jgi:hypothetical protein
MFKSRHMLSHWLAHMHTKLLHPFRERSRTQSTANNMKHRHVTSPATLAAFEIGLQTHAHAATQTTAQQFTRLRCTVTD